jgi:membrane fusion protein, multidrug efflux system
MQQTTGRSDQTGQQQQYEPPQSHRRWLAPAIILAVLIAAILLWRHYSSAQSAAAARGAGTGAVTITTATATKGDIGVYLDAIGTVTPVYTVSVTSQVNGPIVAVHYKEAQFLHKGDPLIDIDARPYRATLLQAQGTLERDQSLLAQAKMDLARYRAAYARDAIAQQTVADQEKLAQQYEGTVKNDQGTVQYDTLQVQYCHITAPIAGRVGLRLVDPGNVVQSSSTTSLAVITQTQPITVVFTLPEDDLGQVETSLRARHPLTVDALDRTAQKQIASGTLTALDNQIDTTTGTVKARALFDNKDGALYPNQFVNTRLLLQTLQGATLLPSSAIQQNGQTSFVYVIQNDVAHLRDVKVGITNAGMTQVDGINPGEVVADSSFDRLQDKAHVTPAKTTVPATNAQTGSP